MGSHRSFRSDPVVFSTRDGAGRPPPVARGRPPHGATRSLRPENHSSVSPEGLSRDMSDNMIVSDSYRPARRQRGAMQGTKHCGRLAVQECDAGIPDKGQERPVVPAQPLSSWRPELSAVRSRRSSSADLAEAPPRRGIRSCQRVCVPVRRPGWKDRATLFLPRARSSPGLALPGAR